MNKKQNKSIKNKENFSDFLIFYRREIDFYGEMEYT